MGRGEQWISKNTVIIMTSNIGSHIIADPALSKHARETAVQEMLRKHFALSF